MPMSGEHQLPVALSFVLCDAIYRDEQSKKLILVGTFNTLRVARFPASVDGICVFMTLCDGRGTFNADLVLEHVASGIEICRAGGPMEIDEAQVVSDLHLVLPAVEFPEPGKYSLKLQIDDTIVTHRPFQLLPQNAHEPEPAPTGH